LIGIEVKGLDEKTETGRLELKTKFINQHFINELDKIGLQFINIRGTWIGGLIIRIQKFEFNFSLKINVIDETSSNGKGILITHIRSDIVKLY
jgi:hypothetical protein